MRNARRVMDTLLMCDKQERRRGSERAFRPKWRPERNAKPAQSLTFIRGNKAASTPSTAFPERDMLPDQYFSQPIL